MLNTLFLGFNKDQTNVRNTYYKDVYKYHSIIQLKKKVTYLN